MKIFDHKIICIEGVDDKPYFLYKTPEYDFYYWDEKSVDIFADKTKFKQTFHTNLIVSSGSEFVWTGWQLPQLNDLLSTEVINLIKSEDIYYSINQLQVDLNLTNNSLGELRNLESRGQKLLEILCKEYTSYNHYINSILMVLIYEGNAFIEKLAESNTIEYFDENSAYAIMSGNFYEFIKQLLLFRDDVLVDIKKVKKIRDFVAFDASVIENTIPALISFCESRNEHVRDMLREYVKYILTIKLIDILESNPNARIEKKKNPDLKDLKPKYQVLMELIEIQKSRKNFGDEFVGFINHLIKVRSKNPKSSYSSIAKSFYVDVMKKDYDSDTDRRKATRWIKDFIFDLHEYHPAYDWSFLDVKFNKNKPL